MKKHKACYGTDDLLPKHHISFHESQQVEEDKYPWNMLVIERLNLRNRFLAEFCDNTERYEHSLMVSSTTRNFNDLRDGRLLRPGLVGKTQGLAGFPGALSASAVQASGKHFHEGDVLTVGASVGVVRYCDFIMSIL